MKSKLTAKSFKELDDKLVMTVDDYIKSFSEHMRIGMQAIAQAAKAYAAAVMRHPTTAPKAFRTRFPSVSSNTWDVLGWIGNGDLNPEAYRLPFNIARKIKAIPCDRQATIFAEGTRGFHVLNPTTLRESVVTTGELSAAQATLLIDTDNGRVRSVTEQRRVLESRPDYFRPRALKKRKSPPSYRICGTVLIVNGVEIGREELRNILQEMDGKAPALQGGVAGRR